MNYDSSQFAEIAKRLSRISDTNVKNILTPEMNALLMGLGDVSSIASMSQEYAKNLKLQFPKMFSIGIDNDAIIHLSKQLTSSIPSAISENLTYSIMSSLLCNIDTERLCAAMTESISSVVKAAGEITIPSDDTDEDYITADEAPIKEWNIPDTVAIPVANHRIRMRTDIFISILSGIIVPVLLWIAGQIVDLHEAYINAKTESQRIELEQERNDLIRENNLILGQYIDLLNSTDTSNSSESNQIESWKEGLPEVVSDPSASGSAPDLTQGTQNNSPE